MLGKIKHIFLEKRSVQLLFILTCLVPIVVLSVVSVVFVYQSSTRTILSRRESLGRSVGRLASERFDNLIELGVHYTSHASFQKLVREKKWEKAMALLVAEQTPIPAVIDRMVLFDKDSTAWVDWPHVPGFDAIKGHATPTRDWYVAVSREWNPIITDAFQRLSEPKINVVSVVIPIKSTEQKDYGSVLGILNLSMTLDKFSEWSRELTTDEGTKIHFIDQKGHMIGHQSSGTTEGLVDFSSVPAVQKLLGGQEGVELLDNPIEGTREVAAYFSMKPYDWGIFVAQDASAAFRERSLQMRQLIVFIIIIWIGSVVLFLAFYKALFLLHKYRLQEQVLLDSIGDGVFATDMRFTIVLWNKAAVGITGLSAAQVIGKPCCDVFRLLDGKTNRDKSPVIQEAIRRGEIRHLDGNTVMVLHDGRRIPIGDSAAPIVGPNGKITGAIVVFQDKTVEQNLNAAKDEFLAVAAHQLRTPLGVMRWRLEVLLKSALGRGAHNAESKAHLTDMYDNTLSLIRLVNDLLDVSRINQQKVTNKPILVNIATLIRAVLGDSKPALKPKKLAVTVSLPSKMPEVRVDPDLFRQVIRNVLSNAIKYNKSSGTIDILLTHTEDAVQVAVADTGIGIPDAFKPRLFEKFSRATNAVKAGISGSGLGMFVVQSYMKMMKGTVAVESQEGKGTTVTLRLPL